MLAGRAETLMGPYATRTGTPLLDGLAGDVILQGNDDWVGPGHVDVATDDAGQDWMIYHAAPRGSAVLPNGVQRRYMMLDPLNWETVPGTEGTWPVVGGGTPTTERPADPVVTLPVRLTAVGDVTLRAGGAGNGDDDQLGLSVRIDSTGAEYSGDLSATLTGPSKQRLPLQFAVDSKGGGAGLAVGSVPVSVTSGGSLTTSFALRPAARLTPGRYDWWSRSDRVLASPLRRNSRCSGWRSPGTVPSRSARAHWARGHSAHSDPPGLGAGGPAARDHLGQLVHPGVVERGVPADEDACGW